jgi:hypothetical protein
MKNSDGFDICMEGGCGCVRPCLTHDGPRMTAEMLRHAKLAQRLFVKCPHPEDDTPDPDYGF